MLIDIICLKAETSEQMDNRTLKPVLGQTHESYSFFISYLLDDEMLGMYVWAENIHEARQEFLKRVPKAKIQQVKLGWPR